MIKTTGSPEQLKTDIWYQSTHLSDKLAINEGVVYLHSNKLRLSSGADFHWHPTCQCPLVVEETDTKEMFLGRHAKSQK